MKYLVRKDGGWVESEHLTVHQLKPAWSRIMLCRYILRLKARIRELEAELAEREKSDLPKRPDPGWKSV